MSTSRPAVLEVADLHASRRGRGVLRGLSFDLEAGRCLGVTGPNGAGKSTLLAAIAGWLPASRGSVRVLGQPVRAGVVPLEVGLATQETILYPRLTGRQNLALFGFMYGLQGAELKGRVEEMIERFDLGRWAGRWAYSYSAGVARRLHLAIAFIHRPAVLLLDEPTQALDTQARQVLLQSVAELLAQGTTVVLTSMNVADLEHLAHRVLVLVEGEARIHEETARLAGRLGSATVEIELGEGAGEVDLTGIDGVLGWKVEELVLTAQVTHPARTLPAILQRLERQGALAGRVEVRPPSLEQLLAELVPAG
ncbi:MAG TPA: ABC transporter ATP-binding protein [Candidatus Dormibacteraeota bacterium]